VENPARSLAHFTRTTERRAALDEKVADVLREHDRITLEIGSGHGHYLNAYAAAHPEQFCVGIDIILDRFERSEKKRRRAALHNLVFLRAEALEFLAAFPTTTKLTNTFVLFPDPWPKRRHHKNRLIQPSFLTELARHSVPSARLCFRTDFAEYFDAALKVVSAHADWAVVDEPWPFELETVFQARAPAYQSWIARRKA
jgi:tRNA (guanine-N7-)-methyltransferase